MAGGGGSYASVGGGWIVGSGSSMLCNAWRRMVAEGHCRIGQLWMEGLAWRWSGWGQCG